jgi:hypothetical protein
MTPERIAVLLDILEKSAKTPALSHLGSQAMEALRNATLYTADTSAGTGTSESESPPSRTRSK